MARASAALLVSALFLSLTVQNADARVQLVNDAKLAEDVWLTPAAGAFPLTSAALGSRFGVAFEYTSFNINELFGVRGSAGDLHISQLHLYGQVALNDIFELGLSIPVLSFLAGERDTEVDIGNLRLDAKLKLWGPSGSPLCFSYFVKVGLPTYSHGDIDAGELGVRVHHGLLMGGQSQRVVYGVSLAPIHFIRENRDAHLFDLGAYVGFKMHRFVSAQVAFQTLVFIEPDVDEAGFMLSPTLRFTPTPRLSMDVGARIALNDAGRIHTGALALPVGGDVQLSLSLGYRF